MMYFWEIETDGLRHRKTLLTHGGGDVLDEGEAKDEIPRSSEIAWPRA